MAGSSGPTTDRILLVLAEGLEREAALRERQLQDGTVREQYPVSERTQDDRGKGIRR